MTSERRPRERRPRLHPASPYVDFGDVARDRCKCQAQYVSRYILGLHDRPALGAGLRFKMGDDYHSHLIHKDDVEEFVRRYLEHQRKIGAIP